MKCCCPISSHDSNKINYKTHNSLYTNKFKPTINNYCLFCSQKYLKLLEKKVRDLKLDVASNNTHNHNYHHHHHRHHHHNNKSHKNDNDDGAVDDGLNCKVVYKNKYNHFVRINVTDTDNNLNVCMCALYESNDNLISNRYDTNNDNEEDSSSNLDGSICPRCTNIIKQQPIEHRRTLISKLSMLANDVIVNRIDTQYLNAYDKNSKNQDPYTPDSVDSHSPFNEAMDEFDKLNISTDDRATDMMNVSKKSGGVSPTQLKSKLEKLQYSGLNDDDDHCRDTKYTNNRRRRSKYFSCSNCCCCLQ